MLLTDGADHMAQFGVLVRAAAVLGFSAEETERIFCILAGILHIGNLVRSCTACRETRV